MIISMLFYQNKKRVYLVMEHAKNGNLFTYVRKMPNLTEAFLVDLFVQVCQGLQYIHSFKIMHRDIKPENLLIDDKLRVKICDFGWSTALSSTIIRKTFCGTYEYMAPEIFEGGPYDENVDIWSLGILLYELLHGHSPFYGKGIFDIYKNIVAGNIQFKKNINSEAKELIKMILKKEPNGRASVKKILNHPYIRSFQPKVIAELYSNKFRSGNLEKTELKLDLNSIVQRSPTPRKIKPCSLTSREKKFDETSKPTLIRGCIEEDKENLTNRNPKHQRQFTQPPSRYYKDLKQIQGQKVKNEHHNGFYTDRAVSYSKGKFENLKLGQFKKADILEKNSPFVKNIVPLSARIKSSTEVPYYQCREKNTTKNEDSEGKSARINSLLTRYKDFIKLRTNTTDDFPKKVKDFMELKKRSDSKANQNKLVNLSSREHKSSIIKQSPRPNSYFKNKIIRPQVENPYFSKL